jgi:hypothetical protein
MQIRTVGRTGLALVAWLFAACILFQIFLAGLGVFDDRRAFMTHAGFGLLIGWLSLVLVALALIGRAPRGLVGLSVLTVVQMTLQSVFVALRDDLPAIAALHPVNGVLLLLVVLAIGRWAWAIRSEPAGEVVAAIVPSPAAPGASTRAPVT